LVESMEMEENKIGLMAKGAIMGIAEVIPGVSGGTIAFITGIYERLINSIKSFHPARIQDFKEGGFSKLWNSIDGNFLLFLLLGMGVGVGIGVFLISYLLENYPEPLWAFFFGLIVASSIYIGKKVTKWNLSTIGLLIIGIVVAYFITTIAPTEGSANPLMLFTAGAIAISALILPGISGSFMLLLMGMYTIVVNALKEFLSGPSMDGLKVIVFFGLGAVLGLAVFSRVLSWTFKNYENQTLAILTGFMIGSLNKIWPWRNPTKIMNKESGEVAVNDVIEKLQQASHSEVEFKILHELNVIPKDYLLSDPKVLAVCIAAVIGFIAVFALDHLDSKN